MRKGPGGRWIRPSTIPFLLTEPRELWRCKEERRFHFVSGSSWCSPTGAGTAQRGRAPLGGGASVAQSWLLSTMSGRPGTPSAVRKRGAVKLEIGARGDSHQIRPGILCWSAGAAHRGEARNQEPDARDRCRLRQRLGRGVSQFGHVDPGVTDLPTALAFYASGTGWASA